MQSDILEAARRNEILAALPPLELNRLASRLRPASLQRDARLTERGRPAAQVYFPTGCVIALIEPLIDGRSVQTATIGREGVVGAAGPGPRRPEAARAVVRIPGEALCAAPEELRAALAECPILAERLQLHERALLIQVMRAVACNQAHSLSQRLARLILALRDGSGVEDLPTTQEFLAEMLASQRPRVSRIAKRLELAGALRRRRGRIGVADEAALERESCDCYRILRAELKAIGRSSM